MAAQGRKVVIVGAGVIGVSTAYVLARLGHHVTLVDAQAEPGAGASAGNAAQLSWAFGDAMASPAFLRQLPTIARGRDPAFRVEWRLDPAFLIWGLKFLLNTPRGRWWRNTAKILELAELSRLEMNELLAEIDLSFAYRVAGKLHLYADRSGLDAMRATVDKKRKMGLVQHVIDRAEATRIEPAIDHYQGQIAGAIYTPGDAVGDAAAFCRALTDHVRQCYDVKVVYSHTVSGFRARQGSLCAARFEDREEIETNCAVVAAGPRSIALVGDVPEARSITPVRGYSLTVPLPPGAPSVSLTDVKRKLAFATIRDRFRVAGLADITAPGSGFDGARLEALRSIAGSVFPDFFDAGDGISWSGERPMTPTSTPIIGQSQRIKGLYLNIGHGMLGWTLALGSARRLAGLLGA